MVEVTKQVRDAYKEKEGYGYQYAPLDQVLKIVRPILAKNGISLIQSERHDTENQIVTVETLLLHKSGEWIISEVSAPFERLKNMNVYQAAGSAITYLRRYGVSAAVGIASDEDTDAQGEAEQSAQTQAPKPKKITKEQLRELNRLIDETGTDVEKFCQFFQVESLKDMTQEAYQRAVAMLEKKMQKETQ